jgi:hypothetical protein
VKEFRQLEFCVIRSYNDVPCKTVFLQVYMLSYVIKILVFSTLCAFVKYACPFEFRVSVAAIRPSIHCRWNVAITSDSLEIKLCVFCPTCA